MEPAGLLDPEVFPSPKRVRVTVGGRVIADSRRAVLLRPGRGPPSYYFPLNDLAPGVLAESERREAVPAAGQARFFHVRAGGRERRDAAWTVDEPAGPVAALSGHVAFRWGAMDAWYEEDEEVFVHPRDPRVRVDTARSSLPVRATVDGETVAESRRPTLLFETGLPTRYYLPGLDIRQDLLEPSGTVSYCPYKGEARYYSVRIGGWLVKDAAWCYRYPRPEACDIAGLLCFYPEKVALELEAPAG